MLRVRAVGRPAGLGKKLVGLTAIVGVSLLLDGWFAEEFAGPIASGQLKGTVSALRCWGEGINLAIVGLGLVLALPNRWKQPVQILLVCLACACLVDLVKPLVGRCRPEELSMSGDAAGPETWRLGAGWNSSFPSGHTATAFCFARGLSLAFPPLRPVCVLAATGTAISRLVERRHYLSDCVVGALIGWYFASVLIRVLGEPSPRLTTRASSARRVWCSAGGGPEADGYKPEAPVTASADRPGGRRLLVAA